MGKDWQDVIIPHTWNANDMMPGKNGKKAYLGTAWYRKHFNLEQTNPDELKQFIEDFNANNFEKQRLSVGFLTFDDTTQSGIMFVNSFKNPLIL